MPASFGLVWFDLIDDDDVDVGGGLYDDYGDDGDGDATTTMEKRSGDGACDACARGGGGVERNGNDDERLGHRLGWARTRALLEIGGERVDGDAVLRARERRDRA